MSELMRRTLLVFGVAAIGVVIVFQSRRSQENTDHGRLETLARGSGAENVQNAPPRSTFATTRSESNTALPASVDAVDVLDSLLQLPSAVRLVERTALEMTNADMRELRHATLLACLSATNRNTDEIAHRHTESQQVRRHFAQTYCANLDSGLIERDRAAGWMDPAQAPDDSTDYGRGSRLLAELDKSGASPQLIDEWLDLMASTPFPMVTRAMATRLLDDTGPFANLLPGIAELRRRGSGSVNTVIPAVGDLLACQNGPLCAPNRAYTVMLCMENRNCMPGATLLDVRRDLVAPSDWRLAQQIVIELRQLRAQRLGP